jgi:hypothetical protein
MQTTSNTPPPTTPRPNSSKQPPANSSTSCSGAASGLAKCAINWTSPRTSCGPGDLGPHGERPRLPEVPSQFLKGITADVVGPTQTWNQTAASFPPRQVTESPDLTQAIV